MMKTVRVRIWRVFAALALLVLPLAPASAFVDPPTFSPAQPYAGQPIDMSVRAGGCHGFAAGPAEIPFVEVQITGNVVDVIITGIEAYDMILCIFPPGTLTVDIGFLPQGNYTVRVRIRDIDPPFDILPPASEAPLSVLGLPTPIAVPATGLTALTVLAGLLILLAIAAFRRSSNAFNQGAYSK